METVTANETPLEEGRFKKFYKGFLLAAGRLFNGPVFAALLVFSFALLLTVIVGKTDSYPLGADVYGHLFKVKSLYENLQQGNLYPIYTKNWYSGIELFRYWPPLSYYFCCIFMYIAGGDVYISYLMFIFFTFLIGGMGFLLFGRRERRYLLSALLGIIYMLLPDNLRVLFSEGNMPRVFITALLPYFFFFLCEVVRYKNRKGIKYLYLTTILVVFSHIMISAMLGISAFIFLCLYAAVNNEYRDEFFTLLYLVAGYLSAGIILVPGLIGGMVTQNSSASQATSGNMWSSRAIDSLNPCLRFENFGAFYLGISVFIILLLGVLILRRTIFPFFASALIIFAGTTMIVLPIVSALPMSQAFWMIRFIPMAMCLFLAGIMYWEKLKKSWLILFLVLLLVDGSVSFALSEYGNEDHRQLQQELSDKYFLREACENTVNQLAIMDLSNIGSYPSFLVANGYDIRYLFGWAYQGAYTVEEIVELNEAYENGYFAYVFDRLENYGCDSVVLKKDEIKYGQEGLLRAIEASDYDILKENDYAILLKLPADHTFGVKADIENVCIGTGSESISCLYPSFYKLRSDNLDDYTFEELKGYKKIFLSGPEYVDKQYAEELIQSLADSGVRVYIDMNNLMEDKGKGRNSFLGVVAQPIVFTSEFPVLKMNDGSSFKLPSITDQYEEWRTVYFTNIKDVRRSARYKKGDRFKELAYLGDSPNENITYIGFNLVYYCYVTRNEELYSFLDEVFEEDRERAASKRYVDIDVSFGNNEISIISPEEGVVTSIANIDSFVGDRKIGRETFVVANMGETRIRVVYAHLFLALAVSFCGILLYILLQILPIKKENEGSAQGQILGE